MTAEPNATSGRLGLAIAVSLSALLLPAFASAAALDASLSLNVGNDFLVSGISETGGKVSATGEVDLTWGHFFLNAWLANVDFGAADGSRLENGYYGGYRGMLGSVGYEVSVSWYHYIGTHQIYDDDYGNITVGAQTDIGPFTAQATAYYSPNNFGQTGPSVNSEFRLNYETKWHVTLYGSVAYQMLDKQRLAQVYGAGIPGYGIYVAGASYPVSPYLTFDLKYSNTSANASRYYVVDGVRLAGERVVASFHLSWEPAL